MTHETALPVVDATTPEERWAQWIAKGAARDRRTRSRVARAAIFAACGLAAGLAVLLVLA